MEPVKRNYLVTGPVGSGKSTIARAMASTLGTVVIEFDHQTGDVPSGPNAEVIIIDEMCVEVSVRSLSTLESWLRSGVRLVFVARDIATTAPDVIPLLQRYGGFHHIQTEAVNSLLAEVEVLPLSNGASVWEELFAGMRPEKRTTSVDRVLSDLSAAVADADVSDTARSTLNARIGLLASAVRCFEGRRRPL